MVFLETINAMALQTPYSRAYLISIFSLTWKESFKFVSTSHLLKNCQIFDFETCPNHSELQSTLLFSSYLACFAFEGFERLAMAAFLLNLDPNEIGLMVIH